jgi:hypothetical protein
VVENLAPRQSQLQYHESESPAPVDDVPGSSPVRVPVVGVVPGSGRDAAAGGAEGTDATLTCETEPLSPGLPIRTLTLTFAGPAVVGADTLGDVGAGDAGVGVAGASGTDVAVAEGVSEAISGASGVVSGTVTGSDAASGAETSALPVDAAGDSAGGGRGAAPAESVLGSGTGTASDVVSGATACSTTAAT